MSLFGKGSVFMLAVLVVAAPRFALADDDGAVVTSKLYVDTTKVAISQGTGPNNVNVGKTLIVNASGNLELGTIDSMPSGTSNQVLQHNGTTWASTTMDSAPTASSNKPVTSDGINTALNAKQTKPSSGVAEGKVLTYTGNDANANVSAAYVKVPVATGDPSAASNPATPSDFASIWIQ
jgi:hypothetical protein